MARKRKKRGKGPSACKRCGLLAEATDFDLSDRPGRWFGGLCPGCREQYRRERHIRTGQKLLDAAKASTVTRDGKEFTVLTLPPKRRGGRR